MAGVVGPPDIGAATSGMGISNCANIVMSFRCPECGKGACLDIIDVEAVRIIPPRRPTWQDA
jgi:hypothetical protein